MQSLAASPLTMQSLACLEALQGFALLGFALLRGFARLCIARLCIAWRLCKALHCVVNKIWGLGSEDLGKRSGVDLWRSRRFRV